MKYIRNSSSPLARTTGRCGGDFCPSALRSRSRSLHRGLRRTTRFEGCRRFYMSRNPISLFSVIRLWVANDLPNAALFYRRWKLRHGHELIDAVCCLCVATALYGLKVGQPRRLNLALADFLTCCRIRNRASPCTVRVAQHIRPHAQSLTSVAEVSRDVTDMSRPSHTICHTLSR